MCEITKLRNYNIRNLILRPILVVGNSCTFWLKHIYLSKCCTISTNTTFVCIQGFERKLQVAYRALSEHMRGTKVKQECFRSPGTLVYVQLICVFVTHMQRTGFFSWRGSFELHVHRDIHVVHVVVTNNHFCI